MKYIIVITVLLSLATFVYSAAVPINDVYNAESDWTSLSSSAERYNTNVVANHKDWDYALEDTREGSATSDNLSLYSADSSIIAVGSAYTPIYWFDNEILYDTLGDTIENLAFDSRLGTIDDQDEFLRFFIDNSILGLGIDGFSFRWAMTGANDNVEGAFKVPEPAALLLFCAGLVGFAGRRLSRKMK